MKSLGLALHQSKCPVEKLTKSRYIRYVYFENSFIHKPSPLTSIASNAHTQNLPNKTTEHRLVNELILKQKKDSIKGPLHELANIIRSVIHLRKERNEDLPFIFCRSRAIF